MLFFFGIHFGLPTVTGLTPIPRDNTLYVRPYCNVVNVKCPQFCWERRLRGKNSLVLRGLVGVVPHHL